MAETLNGWAIAVFAQLKAAFYYMTYGFSKNVVFTFFIFFLMEKLDINLIFALKSKLKAE
ncbi:MAG: hypothetical protein J6U14_02595 [Bacteroidaceae bacterium]|nr:hypothetical protein [Bacteroidaceae bacterium]